jgi:hypothetical protein
VGALLSDRSLYNASFVLPSMLVKRNVTVPVGRGCELFMD